MKVKIEEHLCGGLYETKIQDLDQYLKEYNSNDYNTKYAAFILEDIKERLEKGETVILQRWVKSGDIIMPQYDQEFHITKIEEEDNETNI